MTSSHFDRVRPRVDGAAAEAPSSHDVQGKRALFSSTAGGAPGAAFVGRGGAEVECSRCGVTTTLPVPAALRLAFPALHLGVRVRLGDRMATLALLRRSHPSWLRCPACGHGSWVRVTVLV